MKVTAV